MKYIQNNPKHNVEAMLQGYFFERKQFINYDSKYRIIHRNNKSQVALISGGGSGHEPAHFGYVGDGMLTASVNGAVFVPPSAEAILEAIKKTDAGKGVLLIVKNFASDIAVFSQAKKEAEQIGHIVEMIIVTDDHSIENDISYKKRHRGVAGTILVHKIVGSYAKEGVALADLKIIGNNVIDNLYTLGVALTPARLPGNETPSYTLDDDEVYFGVGIHGEEGYRKEPYISSEQLAIELINKLRRLNNWVPYEKYALLVNGLGSTPLMEQYVFANDLRRLFNMEQLDISFVKVGTHLTSYNMQGISLTLLKIVDQQWIEALNQPTDASHW
ncbi:DhaKLM operon coactivator DhaQ [Alkalibacterium sp. 20]|uniref:DhaKLM operon coactivator DhaQ n=1 Tax=Alkalibacterium sp. 20 TaxID=1798803 RepID=UPI0009003F6F|nr:DhaKLM operon coactivator DhaQ [Alkalibacterium sp. 20]OJF95926.1 DhaKLM operon coactivator DhaQ [Alkalibacterium sp. 20]